MQKTEKMNLASFLTQDGVLRVRKAADKKTLIEKLVQHLCRAEEALDKADVLKQLLAREEEVPTTLETGVAIPHLRIEELEDFRAVLAVLEEPIPADKEKGHPIKAMFLFLSPAKAVYFQQHLQLWALSARTFTSDFIGKLVSCKNEKEILNLLQ